jgi:2-dehydro-3-deoxy-D-arabinonate dehydratase
MPVEVRMKLIQFFLPGKGKRVGVIQGDRVLDITSIDEDVGCTLDLVTQGKTARGVVARATWLAKTLHRRGLDWRELQRPPSRRFPHLLVPIDAPEVWGAKDTYALDDGRARAGGTSENLHKSTVEALPADDPRPILFFKATAHRVAGPHAPIAIRQDSTLTLPEAGLAVVLGAGGAVVAFTVCNDVAARDIEQRGLEYQSQARIYLGSCALGPCLTTPDEIDDPCALQVRCSILRAGEAIFSEAANTARLLRPVEALVPWLLRDNPVPAGTVLSTGTGIVVSAMAALSNGDRVDIEAQSIGRLSNPVRGH